MPGNRERASRAFGAFGVGRAFGALRSAAVRDLRVLAYHRILPRLDERDFPFDAELVSALETEFAWQMEYVARHCAPVSCRQVVAALDGGPALPRRAVLVTFDDGFRDNAEVAWPILERCGVPAVFFVTTGYVGSARLFWFDRVVHLFLRSRARSIRLDTLDLTLELPEVSDARRAAALRVLDRLKRVGDAERLRVLRELDAAAGVAIDVEDGGESAASRAMTWPQARAMAAAGMEFGSHTVTHPILSAMADAEALRAELETSKSDIERETGRPVCALAYPVGGADAVNAQVLAAVERAGYRIAFTYQSGINRLPLAAPFLLKRIHVERYTSRSMFEAALQWPELFAR